MLIDTFQLATEGVGPGFSTYSFALLGYSVEIQITPIPTPTRQGGGGVVIGDTPRFEVIIRIRYKGKVWEDRRTVSAMLGKSLEKVVGVFKHTISGGIKIVTSINNVIRSKISVKIKDKP